MFQEGRVEKGRTISIPDFALWQFEYGFSFSDYALNLSQSSP
jgi:hypothetical protein